MSRQITIEVSDQVARRAAQIAAQTQQRVEEVLAGWLETLLSEMPVDQMSDDDVLALAQLQLTSEEQAILSDLLARNREGILDEQQRRQLDELMRIYEHGLLRKSQALRVAVQRGLLEPLHS